ncbi:MAG: bifunctional diguanylate cyclase/phosphodiesterase [Hyphomicrobiales bacterium]|nr:bifunctional diguanylate cyclase/phosphodiesterase [Hyphomicrobiales bacterium]
MPTAFNLFRVIAISVVSCLTLAAISHHYLFNATENVVGRSMRHDIAWTGTNGRLEAAHFEKYVARFGALGTTKDAEAAQLYYQILRSRLSTWNSGVFRKFIESSPERLELLNTVTARVENLETDIARIEMPDARKRVLDALSEISPVIEQIGAETFINSMQQSSAVRDDLRYHQELYYWLFIALMLSGVIAIVFTAYQNRSLRLAHLAEAKQADKLFFLARHDSLTKLPNRSAFEAAYTSALERKTGDDQIVIAAIDLDGFKSVNDLLGHAAGDAVLIAVSKLLTAETLNQDSRNVVCRIGGDEFLALLWMPSNAPMSMEFANRILKTLSRPLETRFGEIMIGASIGMATSEDNAVDDLIVSADLALTRAKVAGKGVALSFQPDMLVDLKRRLRLEADLGLAVAADQIKPYYQPKVDPSTLQLTGLEALARWRHPELGWISPAEFVPIAEGSGAIFKIGKMMLDAACRDAISIPSDISISVNLSVLQILNDDIVDVVKQVLSSHRVPASRLTLEITESVMMTDTEKVLDVLTNLKKLGVRISLDDFGTGYSALSYLARFNWDELKIDRSFIQGALCDPMNLTIIRTVKILAQEIDAKLTIEGVETHEQHELLRGIGCDTAQGYLFGPPVPLADLEPLLLGALTGKQTKGKDEKKLPVDLTDYVIAIN